MRLTDIDQLFSPGAIAVFGASDEEHSIGGMVFRNVLAGGFKGAVYPVNPKYDEVAGVACYSSLSDIDKHVDLALIATPPKSIPAILDQCGAYGVKVAVVHSSEFNKSSDYAAVLEERLIEAARRNGVRVLGPDCLGVMRPRHQLNASAGRHLPRVGGVALVSQSGAICTAMIDWSEARQIGLSAVISLGAAADVDFGDLLDYLALDAQTQCILMYVEGVRNARRFMSGLRAAARIKPVILVKAGHHPAGARETRSHTGSLMGSEAVFRAVTERAGVVHVSNLDQLFAAAQVFGTRRHLAGDRLAIITNGGGPGVLAADRTIALGMSLAELNEKTRRTLEEGLPDYWSHGNPVDVIGDAQPERFRMAIDACLADPGVDGLLSILVPITFNDPLESARQLIEASKKSRKPVLACWMGGAQVAEAQALLSEHKVAHFDTPEAAVEAFSFLVAHQRNQQLLIQSPAPLSFDDPPDVEGARLIIEGVMAEGRKKLGTIESKAILAAFRIPTMQAVLARTPNEALMAAEALGFPVVMKINSPDLEHKSDVDGVKLNIEDPLTVRRTFTEIVERAQRLRPSARLDGVTVEHMASTRAARELMIGVCRDKVFGPVIKFGAGGTQVDVLGDHAFGLPPLNAFIIETMIDNTRIARLMGAFQNMPPMNRAALARILQRVSEMVCELPEIIGMDINPLIGDDKQVIAVDVGIHVDYRPPQQTTYGHMAIHPYPIDLIERVQLPDGKDLVIRPVRPEDAEMEQRFVRGLSEQTKYYRFMQAIKELTPEMLVRFTQIDYDREMALIGVVEKDGEEVEVGIARYMARPGGEACEFAIVVSDDWGGLGIGSRLMRSLMHNARVRGFRIMDGEVLTANARMLALMKSLGFRIETDPNDMAIKIVTKLL